MMDKRVMLLCIVLLSVSWLCEARQIGEQIVLFERIEQEVGSVVHNTSGIDSETLSVCSVCKDIFAKVISTLKKDGTKNAILKILHAACGVVKPVKTQCNTLVNTYVPVLFVELKLIKASTVCRTLDLCRSVTAFSFLFEDANCERCHLAISELIVKLKDPDTQLEILELLLKACNSMDNYAQKCKKYVFEYAPIILSNAEHFLETNDVCAAFHVCKPPPIADEQASETVAMLADS